MNQWIKNQLIDELIYDSMILWIYESMNQWINESMNQWIKN